MALQATLPGFAVWTAPAVWGLQRCVERAIAYYGWPDAKWKAASDATTLAWSNWLHDWTPEDGAVP